MIDRKYDPQLPYRFVQYGRMSDPHQNPRSPEQQFNTIKETMARCGYSWNCVRTYRDDGISGRYLRKRPGFQHMLRDIEAGLVQVDLITVDTLERFGRAEEIAELRRKLSVEYGILIVAADNNFADPTGIVGKAVGLVENIRSTEDGRIKAHNVVRGKKDAAQLKHWPGGPPPFGHQLKRVVNEAISPPEVYSILEPEPREGAAMALAFARAAVLGEGDLRLSQWWNNSPEIPDDFKPISPFTMGYRLENPIYIGTLRWGKNRTGVVNDTRVIELNPDGAKLVPDFCPPLVSQEQFDQVQLQRQARAEQMRRSRRQRTEGGEPPADKLIAPQARGLTLKYILTGLARCGCCNASMRPVPSGRKSKAGRCYVYYTCPRHNDGACKNSHHVPEDRLREAVLARVRSRLFPPPEQVGQLPGWLPELLTLVRQELQRCRTEEPDTAAATRQELADLDRQLAGWTMTLGDPALPAVVRVDIVGRYEHAKLRQQQLIQTQAEKEAMEKHVATTLDAPALLEQLRKLSEVLAGFNPTLVNLELSKHIDRISCYPDGKVEMRGTFLGLFEGAVALLSRNADTSVPPANASFPTDHCPVKPRRRGRLRVPDLSADNQASFGHLDTALDPQRFAALPEPFLWTETFIIEEKRSWAEEYASEVARLRATGMTVEALAKYFEKSIPTIRNALQKARQTDETVRKLPKKMPRRRWAEDHAEEVARLRQTGMTFAELARHFKKSDPTIRAALRHAAAKNGKPPSAPSPPPDPPTGNADRE